MLSRQCFDNGNERVKHSSFLKMKDNGRIINWNNENKEISNIYAFVSWFKREKLYYSFSRVEYYRKNQNLIRTSARKQERYSVFENGWCGNIAFHWRANRRVSFHVWSKRGSILVVYRPNYLQPSRGRALQISPRFLDSNPVSTLCAPRTKM